MVIDELIVTLGLDSRKFTEGQRDALAAFKKGKEGALDFGKSIQESAQASADALGFVRKGALGLIGAFAGAEVAGFVGHMITMDATTGRMAASIGTSVQNLSLWQEMVKRVGGDASSATSALSAMQEELNQIKYGNKMPDGGLTSLANQARIDLRTDNADTVYRKAQAFLAAQIASGKLSTSEARTFAGYLPGMNQDIFNLMTDNFKKLEAEARAMGGATGQSAAEARELQKETAALTNAFENLARETFPALTAVANIFTRAIKQDIADVKWFMGLFGMGGAKAATTSGSPEMDDARQRLADGLNRHVFDAPGVSGVRASRSDREAWIRKAAVEEGVDPDVAFRVAKSEGFNEYTGDNNTSFGDFQLHLSRQGNAVGDEFRKATGLDPRDPANERAMDRFALRWASSHGWGDYHGAARVGIGQFQGIGARTSAAGRGSPAASSTSSSEVNIGTMNINAPNATDADGIAADVGGAIKRQKMINPANAATN